MDLSSHHGQAGEMPVSIQQQHHHHHHHQQQPSFATLQEAASTKLKLMGSGNGAQVSEETTVSVARPHQPPQLPPFESSIGLTPVSGALVANANMNNNISAGNNNSKKVRYRECQKNHAAGIGGYALDGCGEFLPSGDEGHIESLKCAACDCHRNFHRREVEGEAVDGRRKATRTGGVSPLATIPTSGRSSSFMGLSTGGHSDDQSDEHEHAHGHGHGYMSAGGSGGSMKKRFRTKFSNEQKERMYSFADRLGWKIQKHDEADVQQFCSEVGVKRHVLKVWMHNNKNTYGKKQI